jgi:C1A family cysteine protease
MMLLFIGVFFVVSAENQINSQKAQIISLQKTIKTSGDQITKLSSENASESAQIKTLLAKPPQIKYVTQTQYVEQPVQEEPVQVQPVQPAVTSTDCEPDYDGMGGQICRTNTGVTTHCDPNYNGMGGMSCH